MNHLIDYITNTLKSRNLEPLAFNELITFETFNTTLWSSLQEYLLLQDDINPEELLINTNKAVITQLRLADALCTGKVIYDFHRKNHQKIALYNLFANSIGLKSDIKMNIKYLKKSNKLISSPEYILIEDNLQTLEKSFFTIENFLKQKKYTYLPDTYYPKNIILIEDIDTLLEKNTNTNNIVLENSNEEITNIEHAVMESF